MLPRWALPSPWRPRREHIGPANGRSFRALAAPFGLLLRLQLGLPLLSRRDFFLYSLAAAAAHLPLRVPVAPLPWPGLASDDYARLQAWLCTLRAEGLHQRDVPLSGAVARVGELALGTPYQPGTLDAYLNVGSAAAEPLTVHLDRFDCVTLVESCLAAARAARLGEHTGWPEFLRQIERMRYRDGLRGGYASRLHYFSEWIADNERRGLVRNLGEELGGVEDARPLRFMSEHRSSYPALSDDGVFTAIAARERRLDGTVRWLIPTARIAGVADRIHTGDVLAFATAIPGLDVTHTGLAYRDAAGTLRVLHAPLSGGAVEVSRTTLPEYVAAIRRSTGILIARPLPG